MGAIGALWGLPSGSSISMRDREYMPNRNINECWMVWGKYKTTTQTYTYQTKSERESERAAEELDSRNAWAWRDVAREPLLQGMMEDIIVTTGEPEPDLESWARTDRPPRPIRS